MNLFRKYQALPVWRKATALVCMMLLSFSLMSAMTLASFRATGYSSDSVSVAAWALDMGINNSGDLSIDCNTTVSTASCSFWVKNQENGVTCEVDMYYVVTIKLSSALPNGLTMTLDGASGSVSSDGKQYSFSNSGWYFTAGNLGSKTHTLTFTADAEKISSDISIPNISIVVTGYQMD